MNEKDIVEFLWKEFELRHQPWKTFDRLGLVIVAIDIGRAALHGR